MTSSGPSDHEDRDSGAAAESAAGAADRITHWAVHRHEPDEIRSWSARQHQLDADLTDATSVDQATGVLAHRHDLDVVDARDLLVYLAEAQDCALGRVAHDVMRDAQSA
jgi:hypothetical protein